MKLEHLDWRDAELPPGRVEWTHWAPLTDNKFGGRRADHMMVWRSKNGTKYCIVGFDSSEKFGWPNKGTDLSVCLDAVEAQAVIYDLLERWKKRGRRK
ncbi:MAG TPA: hypothetical protein VKT73_15285 [Xanthobacteraceae bacterium]|nr:hypothetical protein [Xanthobacteraceae bacterium]